MSPDQTPVVTCSDGSGALPSCAPLAVPIVAPQGRGQQRYTHGEALNQGTLFPGLNLPFFRMEKAAGLADSPLTQLQALEFVVTELGLYLDTHPDDFPQRQHRRHGAGGPEHLRAYPRPCAPGGGSRSVPLQLAR